ncbi:hypothetical protein [Brucella sp. 22210]|uniref:hypothetical protein n=1 Tax=Brucella sp. 22210 TaxID=3453892 RepID=UPI003F8706D1
MALSDIVQPFVWGANGGRMTPEEIARQREIAASLLGVDTSPVGHWTQGAARMANALVGRVRESRADAASQQNAADSKARIASLLTGLGGGAGFPEAVATGASPTSGVATGTAPSNFDFGSSADALRSGIVETAQAIGADPVDLATAISYETGGTFNPTKAGPTTQYGQHRGLIQFGEPQAQQYGVDWNNPIGSQLGANGAVANYFRDRGFKPGMSGLDLYSTINAGSPGRYSASDAANGGAPGSVADKWNNQMSGHRQKALALLGGGIDYTPTNSIADTPQQAIQAVSPVADPEGLFAPGADVSQADLDFARQATGPEVSAPDTVPSVAPENGNNFDARWNAGAVQQPIVPQAKYAPGQVVTGPDGQTYQNVEQIDGSYALTPYNPNAQAPAVDQRLLDINDRMFGGALSPSGSNGVAQALTGFFPEAPSAIRAPITPATNAAPNSSTSGVNPAIIEALSNPYASEQERSIAGLLLNQQMQQNDPLRQLQVQKAQAEIAALRAKPTTKYGFSTLPDGTVLRTNEATGQAEPIYNAGTKPTSEIQNFEYARQNGFTGSFADYQQAIKKAGSNSTVINNGTNSDKFVEKSDEAAAKRFDEIVAAGQTAPQTMADMQQLLDLGSQIGTGKAAQAKAVLGPYAQSLGINIDGMGDIQAYQAITSRLAPQMRAVGSGSSSDRDVALFFQSLPSLGNTPGGNEIIANTIKAVAQNKMNAADIARRAQRGEISWQDADKQIAELPNPYDLFKQFQKDTQSGNPDNGGWKDMGNGVRIRRKQ